MMIILIQMNGIAIIERIIILLSDVFFFYNNRMTIIIYLTVNLNSNHGMCLPVFPTKILNWYLLQVVEKIPLVFKNNV